MSRKPLCDCRTYREVHQALSHAPGLAGVRNGGRHVVYRGPRGSVPVPSHNGDVPHGTLKSIVRLAAMAGLASVVLAVMVMFV